ncbi:polysaccharide pyruvyl transferase family protein [Herbiconiux flava]|uniref:Polysaccharide pyruvyl transferase domain-containing protein n=1 Tax=Herbiconiux flava TaxID=881268 RepID=A0A852SI75_9MICO|nr:polysaccharide pyruvyl transferase family protein [Herbiconiux flava]NYD68883.1 hypothetical protein [Herbiconiux flava]GLK15625.1 GumL protein [Herbiconiux flava]
MALRSFYWDGADRSRRLLRSRKSALRIGNAGDIYNTDLIRYLYSTDTENVSDEGRRLLLVGSIVHRMLAEDIICGVGTKGTPIPPTDGVRIRGVRGPFTLSALRDAGFDISDVRFELDPGLLVGEVFKDRLTTAVVPGRVSFIPHYRDRNRFRSSRKLRVIDIDSTAGDLVTEILKSEFVYSSSLHGIIFAHALGRPCLLVQPSNPEPEVKYRDYYASVGVEWTTPGDLHAVQQLPKPGAIDLGTRLAAFDFPSAQELEAGGLLTSQ